MGGPVGSDPLGQEGVVSDPAAEPRLICGQGTGRPARFVGRSEVRRGVQGSLHFIQDKPLPQFAEPVFRVPCGDVAKWNLGAHDYGTQRT